VAPKLLAPSEAKFIALEVQNKDLHLAIRPATSIIGTA